jgi:hypothetical protein
MSDFITELVSLYESAEAPEIFFYWSALSAISAVVKKDIFISRGGLYKLYPNMYCFLVAESGGKKSLPIVLAKNLVDAVNNTRIVSGRNSIEEILDELGRAYSVEGGGIIKDAQGYMISTELSVFLIHNPAAIKILTELYDTQNHEKEFKYSLKSGKAVLSKPCLSLFGATNEEYFNDLITSTDAKGGFVARTFIVYSNEKKPPNALVDEQDDIDISGLIDKLKDISKIKGQFKWRKDAGDLFKEWYGKFTLLNHNDPTHTVNRLCDHIVKISMCIGLSKGEFPYLELDTVDEAIARGLATLNGAKQIVMGSGKATLASQTKLIIRTLIQLPNHEVTRHKLLVDGWGHFDSMDLDKIVETLSQARAINIERRGKDTVYSLRKEALESYLQLKRTIQ